MAPLKVFEYCVAGAAGLLILGLSVQILLLVSWLLSGWFGPVNAGKGGKGGDR